MSSIGFLVLLFFTRFIGSSQVPENLKKLTGDELSHFLAKTEKLWESAPSKFTKQEKLAKTSSIRFIKANRDDEVADIQIRADIPASFDSRKQWPNCPEIGKVRDQSDCGSAAHLVAVEIATDRTCIHSNGTFNLPLSAEDPLSCCVGELSACGDGWGCDGSWPVDILKWWISHGLCTGGEYGSKIGCKPYKIYPCDKNYTDGTTAPPCPGYHTPKCEHTCDPTTNWQTPYLQDKHFGKNHYKIGKKMTEIQTEIMTNGPVVASFILYEDFWDYKSGIYVHTAGDESGGMATKIIGWDNDQNGVPYWLCVHQWGEDFGENGYIKILRGVNECKIESQIITAMPDLDKHN